MKPTNHTKVEKEQLTPLDLLMPGTYVQASLILDTSEPTSSILPVLQQGLDQVVARLPWLSGRVSPTDSTPGSPPSLEIRWSTSDPAPKLVDKGSISSSYEPSCSQGMPPKNIPGHVSPLEAHSPGNAPAGGAPVFAASIFRFSDGRGLGLYICVHHNAVDATGFAEVLTLWSQAIRGLHGVSEQPAANRPRLDRLTDALLPELQSASTRSAEELWASHPEHSKTPPAFPSEFAPCACELFRIPTQRIDELKKRVEALTATTPTTTNLITTLVWQAVTRARAHRNPALREMTSRLVTAVNGRGRLGPEFSTPEEPYFGNAVLYALAELPVDKIATLSSQNDQDCLAGVSSTIAESQSPRKIDKRSIAELCSLVDRVDDYRGIFVGWDLFSSRDFTVTSWNGLDLYGLDFGEGLGKPQYVRPPYVEADGVGFVLPRKPGEDAVEAMVMLRRDDMDFMVKDQDWLDLGFELQG